MAGASRIRYGSGLSVRWSVHKHSETKPTSPSPCSMTTREQDATRIRSRLSAVLANPDASGRQKTIARRAMKMVDGLMTAKRKAPH